MTNLQNVRSIPEFGRNGTATAVRVRLLNAVIVSNFIQIGRCGYGIYS